MCIKREYCDFVVWSTKSMTIKRISRDEQFVEDCIPKVRHSFERGVLPELVGKFYSRAPMPSDAPAQLPDP